METDMSMAVQQQDTLTPRNIELIKRTLCAGVSDDDLEIFLNACRRTQLDPLMKQIHAVKRFDNGKERITIQTGIDGYRLIADRTGRYMPGRSATYEFDEMGNISSCTAYCKKLDSAGNWHDLEHTVYWTEYVAFKKDGGAQKMWVDKPRLMIAKCAEAALLRKAFPADLSGIYTHDEMQRADSAAIEIVSSAEPIDNRISAQEAEKLDQELKAMGEDFKLNAFKHLSKKTGKEITSTSDFTNEQSTIVTAWIEKKRKTLEPLQAVAF